MLNERDDAIRKGVKGLVVKNTGNTYFVRDNSDNEYICKAKGNLRLKGIRSTSPVVVGDIVFMDVNPDGTAFITDIEDRRNYIVRKASNLSKHSHILAANIDLALLCFTVRYPETTTVFTDRFLVTAVAYSVPVHLIFNKIDLYDDEDKEYLDAIINLYTNIGYPCLKTSMETGEGVDELNKITAGKTVLLAGHSGVGKSTIINTLMKEEVQKVGKISEYHDKGMHTTTYSEMIELQNGGFIIDTPGIKGFGTIDMNVEEVSHYFPEIFKMSKKCRFNNCLHINEPDCAVLKAVEDHYISESRYNSYLNIIDDINEGKYRL
ncbi:MAG: ribosome small subunit-dependent GTPase A [Fermentimonas sp.]|jgi:ribosome biogenesis GTPase|nr:ribosome small subunit-dependent GTPase A [Fermentimonas sp.]NLC85900.1 ribosome small subunit-dependent GTPase A [Bacteroidales bacterium]HBT86548.1 ribosome small subunit-dependent GTPase A [Porphyromonadaceae bacterium]MDD2930442.1 ribosome small subunit-dependent GTPase A [Fermentimonas sp.]MDD3189087.1 ribosome small subunit-dependent GTPase A [Fermentimonas sp.]